MHLVTIDLDRFRETLVTELAPGGKTDFAEVTQAIERSVVDLPGTLEDRLAAIGESFATFADEIEQLF